MLGRLFTFIMAFVGTSASISDCGQGSRFTITELSLNPDPPIPGKQVDMSLHFINSDSEIIDGTSTTSVTLNFIPLQPTIKPLCEDTQCPIITGPNDRSTSSIWPETVTGSITSKLIWTGLDRTELLCISIKVKVLSKEGTCIRQQQNQTHADLVAAALQLKSPVSVDAFDTPLACFACNGTWV